jgi:hypothetical protein
LIHLTGGCPRWLKQRKSRKKTLRDLLDASRSNWVSVYYNPASDVFNVTVESIDSKESGFEGNEAEW